jgi:2-polyprenyl-3-methyl-5-hydroxy-6-metoxy-1,4-benzoquinol methylase
VPELTVLRCSNCGLAFLLQWSTDFVPALYDYYANKRHGSREQLYNEVNRLRQQHVLASLGKLVRGRRLLDVGCGIGHFVATAHESGWDALGVDLSTAAIETAQRLGARCEAIDLFDSRLRPASYDVVIMSEFIEHVAPPGRFLARAEELLDRGGLLYLTTPNFDSLQRYLFRQHLPWLAPQHLLYFDPRSFARVLRDSTALELVEMQTKNFSVSRAIQAFRQLRADTVSPASAPASDSPFEAAPRASLRSMLSKLEPDRALRSWFVRSPVGATVRDALNRLLNAAGVGDSLVVIARKR